MRTLVFLLASILTLSAGEELLPGSGISAEAGLLPSALWPQFVTTTEDITKSNDDTNKKLPSNTRGVLLRVEGDLLLIDFGRNGIHHIQPSQTDFYDQASALMQGKTKKEFPNFALQLGNKLMTFGKGKNSGAIRFDDVRNTELYVLLYLDDYDPETAQELMDFGTAYQKLKEDYPNIEVVLMPRDREFYNFAFTVGYQVPLIATHVRLGYIKSLQHAVETGPAFVAVDANGRVVARSDAPLDWKSLPKELERLLGEVDLDWRAPRIEHRQAHQRSARWNN